MSAGQFDDNTDREVWFPIYPLVQRYKTVDVECNVLVKLHIGKGMMHCRCAMDMTPDGKAARKNIFRIINGSYSGECDK